MDEPPRSIRVEMFAAIRRFFRWLWSLTPWGRPPGPPAVFIVSGGASMPVGNPGDVCMVQKEDRLYVSTKKGWEQVPVVPSEG